MSNEIVNSCDPMKLVQLLKGQRVFIQTHNCPDPDAIASAFGLQTFLAHFGIEAVNCYRGPLDRITAGRMVEMFDIPLFYAKELDIRPEDAIVLVDSQKNNKNVTDLIGDEVACIDHHPTYFEVEYQYKDVRQVGACATLIAQYFQLCNVPLNQKVATALTFAIKKDTANLSRGITKLDMDMLSFLYDDTDWGLLRHVNANRLTMEDLNAYGAAIRNIQVENGMGFAFIPFDCLSSLIAIISDFILGLDVVDVAVVYALQEEGVRISVRSERPGVRAGKMIFEALEGIGAGGGHESMAGGIIPREVYEKLGDRFEEELRSRFRKVELKMIESFEGNVRN